MIKCVNPEQGRFWTPLNPPGRLELLMPHTEEQNCVCFSKTLSKFRPLVGGGGFLCVHVSD